MIKFPYGICDFRAIMEDGFYYVDRTEQIPQLEETGRQLLLLRPRRFGKSLLLSMLENYYDVAKADKFEALFGRLAIGKNPTKLHNRYFVLKWDFSAVNPQGKPDEIKQALHRYINSRIKNFAINYKQLLPFEIEIHPVDAVVSFQSLLTAIQQTEHSLYLLIDEYDNFANELMMGSRKSDTERYKTLLYGEGSLKALFKVIKSTAAGMGLERVFITGVSPVVMIDITSGYNIAENISLKPKFNDLCGFWESEIHSALSQAVKECKFSDHEVDKGLNMMRTFYNGYCFSYENEPLVYNPTLAVYFMKNFKENCKYPQDMLDENLAMDKGKLRFITQIAQGDQMILDALTEENLITIPTLEKRFGVEDMLYMTKDNIFLASLLYYFGVLTMAGKTEFGDTILRIPNLVIRKVYVEQIKEMLLPEGDFKNDAIEAAKALYQHGSMQPLCNFVEKRYFKVFSNRDYRWSNELTVKTAFLTLLFNDTFYIMDSEAAIERSYADLTMIVRPDMRRYKLLDIIIEFKFVSLPDAGLTGQEAQSMTLEELKAIKYVKDKLSKAQKSLERYREILVNKYNEAYRLHCYGVVSVGFARLVWEEMEFQYNGPQILDH